MSFLFSYGLGVDVSEHHVRFARASAFGGVKHTHEIVLPEGLVIDEEIVKPAELKALIVEQVKTIDWLYGPRARAVILVPESRVFSTDILVDARRDKEDAVREAIRLAQKRIPVPFDHAYLSASLGEIVGDQMRINVYASQKKVIDGLRDVFLPFFPRMLGMEVNSKALHRLLLLFFKYKNFLADKKSLVCVTDVGHSWSTVSVFTLHGSQLFSRTLSHAGHVENVDGKLVLTLEAARLIAETIAETGVFFRQKGTPIAVTILCGVEAMQAFVINACKTEKEIPIVLMGDALMVPNIPQEVIYRFGPAIGAAYRALHPGKYAYQHNFLSGAFEASDR